MARANRADGADGAAGGADTGVVFRFSPGARVALYGADGGAAPSGWSPAVDVYETPAACVVTAELAGGEDLHVALDGDGRTLRLSGRRRCRPSFPPDVVCHRLEIATGPFERCVVLPCAVDPDAAQARTENGLLYVVLPKARRTPVRVPVSSGSRRSQRTRHTNYTDGGHDV